MVKKDTAQLSVNVLWNLDRRAEVFYWHTCPGDTACLCIKLGVRSLANASRARQFNPLNPPGVGWVPLPQTNMAAVRGCARSCMRGRSCVVVRGRARSVVRGRARSCAVVRAWSVMRGRAWSCAVGRARSCAVVRGHAWSVVRGRARSCVCGRSCVVVRVRGRAWLCRSARFAASTAASTAVLPASRPALP